MKFEQERRGRVVDYDKNNRKRWRATSLAKPGVTCDAAKHVT